MRWNAVVQPNDDVFVLGDFAMGKGWQEVVEVVLAQMSGRKVLVKGNHDKADSSMKKLGFAEVVPFGVVKIKDRTFKMSHYPYAPETPDEDDRFLDRRLRDDGHWLLHGHVHCAWKVRRRMLNVGCDVHEFQPISEKQITAIVEASEALYRIDRI